MNEPRYIYALGDPRTGHLNWVGITLDPYNRWHQHTGANTRHNLRLKWWLIELKAKGLKPAFIVLETITDDFARVERDWIMRLLDEGHPLLNIQKRTDTTEFAINGVSG